MSDETGPTYAEVSRNLSAWLLDKEHEWAGIPMPIPGLRLTVEPSHPRRDQILGAQAIVHEDAYGPFVPDGLDDDPSWTTRNAWYSRRLRCVVGIVTNGTTVRTALFSRNDHNVRLVFAMNTMHAALAWTLETEIAAIQRLATLINSRMFNVYMLTGTFMERSPRSDVVYIFRRCRPTIALRDQRILCTLCLHPIGYYAETHAGSLCPTDDVIAHLLLMRGDEPFFWRRANQHSPWHPESGL